MTAYTPLGTEQAQQILDDNHLGTLKADPSPITKGNTNSLYMVETTTGDYCIKIYEPSLDPYATDNLQEKYDFHLLCNRKGLPVSELVGKLGEFDGKAYEITRRIKGEHPKSFSREQMAQLGETVARFHVETMDTPPFTKKRAPNSAWLMASEMIESLGRMTTKPNLGGEISYMSSVSLFVLDKVVHSFSQPKYKLPRGKIHGDLSHGNIIEDANGKIHLLDFEHAADGPLVADLTKVILKLCDARFSNPNGHPSNPDSPPGAVLDKGKVSAFLQAYNAIRPLAPEELKVLPEMLHNQAKFQEIASRKFELSGKRFSKPISAGRLKAEMDRYDWNELAGQGPASMRIG